VDDEPQIGQILTKFLTKHNYRVIFFTSGKKALDYLKSNSACSEPFGIPQDKLSESVTLLLTDMQMPGMTGLELAREVKPLYPALPIIVMSGSADGRDRDEIFSLGADFIYKPFELAELLERVERTATVKTHRV
jgi:DNA-binding response OmpR family regulator